MKRLVPSFAVALLAGCAAAPPPAPAHSTDVAPAQRAAARLEDPAIEVAASRATETRDQYQLRMLARAEAEYAEFVRKAGSEPRFADAVKRARERIEDIRRTREFLAAAPAP